ncbi:uncharacterized protein LOC118310907 [Scophthalmus maximus]|uniref:uncharacterized protein LOC118310907 n=1 Tax=Scophthalmus maximus TaxID=52904 RepID=UPI0015E15B26|nr:uncharacterized protein LOC118310907 [Scophthalmus maximus]
MVCSQAAPKVPGVRQLLSMATALWPHPSRHSPPPKFLSGGLPGPTKLFRRSRHRPPSTKFRTQRDSSWWRWTPSTWGWEVFCPSGLPGNWKLHPCAFFSRRLTPAERNYDIGNRELLAVKLALEEWRHWLEGTKQPFLVWTDHKNLEYLQSAKRLNSRQARWSLFLTRFNFSLSYRPGFHNVKPDALSRQFLEKEEPDSPRPSSRPRTWLPPSPGKRRRRSRRPWRTSRDPAHVFLIACMWFLPCFPTSFSGPTALDSPVISTSSGPRRWFYRGSGGHRWRRKLGSL